MDNWITIIIKILFVKLIFYMRVNSNDFEFFSYYQFWLWPKVEIVDDKIERYIRDSSNINAFNEIKIFIIDYLFQKFSYNYSFY